LLAQRARQLAVQEAATQERRCELKAKQQELQHEDAQDVLRTAAREHLMAEEEYWSAREAVKAYMDPAELEQIERGWPKMLEQERQEQALTRKAALKLGVGEVAEVNISRPRQRERWLPCRITRQWPPGMGGEPSSVSVLILARVPDDVPKEDDEEDSKDEEEVQQSQISNICPSQLRPMDQRKLAMYARRAGRKKSRTDKQSWSRDFNGEDRRLQQLEEAYEFIVATNYRTAAQIEHLMTRNPSLPNTAVDFNLVGFTALHVAALGGSFKVVELLLSQGANPGAKDWRAQTPEDLALLHGPTIRGRIAFDSEDPHIKCVALLRNAQFGIRDDPASPRASPTLQAKVVHLQQGERVCVFDP